MTIDRPRPSLVLASGSPRRRELLASLDLDFTVRPVHLDETPRADEVPSTYVERLACEKAAARATAGELVLAADTTVVLDGEILGKPEDEADARAMLGRLAGRLHVVLTGVALFAPDGDRLASTVERSSVRIAPLTPGEIAWYVATGEPMDKAGSYAIQGLGSLFVEEVEGNYTNVVGLPIPATWRLFRQLGYDLLAFGLKRTVTLGR
ncbi:MAG TPA: Maf family protein [Thermoanaerobaculia bacterium]|nr:Maf family protein [Thermoanaerobaculia bacterium]